ncbi:7779_t:CDS:1, partial [Acaulospora colombiana]
ENNWGCLATYTILLSAQNLTPCLVSRLLQLFTLVHKYSIDSLGKQIMNYLKKSKSTHDVAILLAISQIVDSTALYDKTKKILINHVDEITLEDAKKIGVEATYEIMKVRNKKLTKRNKELIEEETYVCENCRPYDRPGDYCEECGDYNSW